MEAVFATSALEDVSRPFSSDSNGNTNEATGSPAVQISLCLSGRLNSSAGDDTEDQRIDVLKQAAYGVALPAICVLGVIGNLLNLVVLTRRNMKGTAYIYMRGEYKILILGKGRFCQFYQFIFQSIMCANFFMTVFSTFALVCIEK
jgi:hypothetical protein